MILLFLRQYWVFILAALMLGLIYVQTVTIYKLRTEVKQYETYIQDSKKKNTNLQEVQKKQVKEMKNEENLINTRRYFDAH